MANGFYARLAFNNLKNNRKIYFPYLLTCIITVTMFYMIHSLSVNESVAAMHGGDTMQYTLGFGAITVGIFSLIFLFYTNSFVIKRRKKEFGLFNVLGMEKRHLGIVLAFETLFIALIAIVSGLMFGVVLDKLMYLVVARVLHASYGAGFFISWKSMLITFALFAAIFACTYLVSLIRVRVSQPIELLKGENTGEREPKTRHVMAIAGVLCLAAGYICALCTRDVVSAIELFFVAVVLVILGTYFLFTAGSIALLKRLRKNKKYYYKTNHFTSVSGMMYRMKQNSVGLASICILFTMLLVTISTTTSFMVGRNDMIAKRYPYDVIVQANASESENAALLSDVRSLIADNGLTAEEEAVCRYLPIPASLQGDGLAVSGSGSSPIVLIVLPLECYNEMAGESKTLGENEILLYENGLSYGYSSIKLLGEEYSVKEKVDAFVEDGFLANGMTWTTGGFYMVVSDGVLSDVAARYKAEFGEGATALQFGYGVNLKERAEKQIALFEPLQARLGSYRASFFVRAEQSDRYMSLFGGLFFLGVYLGTLFLMATILIIYYKQISEGYEDKKRFEIMQKVGMSYAEVKKSINSQILTVFFLPLVTAGIHVAFAFPMIDLILGMAGLMTTKLFALCSLACFAVFSAVYVAVYLLTARVYYRIVKNKEKN